MAGLSDVDHDYLMPGYTFKHLMFSTDICLHIHIQEFTHLQRSELSQYKKHTFLWATLKLDFLLTRQYDTDRK